MDLLSFVGNIVADLPIYLANGALILAYGAVDYLAGLVAVSCGAAIILLLDLDVQNRTGFRPKRSHSEVNGTTTIQLHTAQILTSISLVLWLIAQWNMGAPVPWIGAAMWVFGLLALFALPIQRFNLLWYVKAGLSMYALAVIGSRIYLSYTSQLTAGEWASLIGSSESAAQVVTGMRGNITTIILWGLWLVIPLGYFSMLVQQIFINPTSIISPVQGAEEVIRRLRLRR